MLSVITCFSYKYDSKYRFNPEYVKSDIRRIISYVINILNCEFDNIIVISDITPNEQILLEIQEKFHKDICVFFKNIGYHHFIPPIIENEYAIWWLEKLCKKASKHININYHILLQKILSSILIPIYDNSNVIEFIYIFTQLIDIASIKSYNDTLSDLFKSDDQIFFYYTGHGIRFIEYGSNEIKDICIIIPYNKNKIEYYSEDTLYDIFNIDNDFFIIFDCCHAENLISLPFKWKKNNNNTNCSKMYISSTQDDQTCGFYSQKQGSLFTYYLIKHFHTGNTNISEMYNYVESHVNKHRNNIHKSKQNISISTNNINNTLPIWIVDRMELVAF